MAKPIPIWLTEEDFEKGLVPLLQKVRSELVNSRGELSDLAEKFGHSERIETARSGITLVVAYLYHLMKEIEDAKREK